MVEALEVAYATCGEGEEEGESDIPRMMSFFHGNGTDSALPIYWKGRVSVAELILTFVGGNWKASERRAG